MESQTSLPPSLSGPATASARNVISQQIASRAASEAVASVTQAAAAAGLPVAQYYPVELMMYSPLFVNMTHSVSLVGPSIRFSFIFLSFYLEAPTPRFPKPVPTHSYAEYNTPVCAVVSLLSLEFFA